MVPLRDANFIPVEDKEKKFVLLIETLAKTYLIGFEVSTAFTYPLLIQIFNWVCRQSEVDKKAWFDIITINTVTARDIDRLSAAQEKASLICILYFPPTSSYHIHEGGKRRAEAGGRGYAVRPARRHPVPARQSVRRRQGRPLL